MKIKLSLALWFLFITLLQAGCYAQAKLVIADNKEVSDPYSWDFGRVKEGEVLKHAFRLKNESKKILNIKDVHTSCGCTSSKVRKKILLPGEETLMEVEFNSQGYSGPVQQHIYVHTDNLDNPIIRFIIKATVVKSK